MSAQIIQLRQPRTFVHVLADLLLVDAELRNSELEWYRTRSDEASERSAKADDLRFALKDEARAMIAERMGVSWDAIASVEL